MMSMLLPPLQWLSQTVFLSFLLFVLCTICVFLCAHVETGGQSWMSFSGTLSTPLKQGPSLAQRSPVGLEWLATEPRDPPVSMPRVLGLQAHVTMPGSSQGPGALKCSCSLSRRFASEAVASPPSAGPFPSVVPITRSSAVALASS